MATDFSDLISGKSLVTLTDNGLGPNGTFAAYRGPDGEPLAAVGQDGMFYGEGINFNNGQSGMAYKSIWGNITAAQIKALHTTPIVLVPPQGPNTCAVLQELIFRYVYNTTAFTTGSQNLTVYYDTLTAFPIALINCLGFLTATANQIANPVIQSNFTVPEANVVNQPIHLSTTTSDPTLGDGRLSYRLIYAVFTFQNVVPF